MSAQPYIDAFAGRAGEPDWLARSRERGIGRFAAQGFPSRRSESWRYLDLRALEERPRLPGAEETQLPQMRLPKGVWLGPIARAIGERPELVRRALGDETGLVALNAAFFAGGYVLDVEPGVAVDETIEIVHPASGSGSLHTRSIISQGAGSRVRLVETYRGTGAYWRNDVVDANLGDGAVLERIVLIEEAAEAAHIGAVRAELGARAEFGAFALLLGGKTVRHEISVAMAGEGARCRIDGAFVVGGDDEANIVTDIDHRAPGGETRELVKGVAAGRGHGAFQGTIRVREGAQRTDAQQTSRNLIIGRRAAIDTKPELEILADDVKCAHGASVGDLDETALFYLRTRGIPEDEARRLLVEGFVREAVERVANLGAREMLLGRLAAKLGAL
ncbi:MAG TPA: Fe-S cluster assembly protein SufD [Stellaceae bacterium]|nr:Fe-S cluster assembly protein SufD [Stellaceae bacterium]